MTIVPSNQKNIDWEKTDQSNEILFVFPWLGFEVQVNLISSEFERTVSNPVRSISTWIR